jgi:hypothetical protein
MKKQPNEFLGSFLKVKVEQAKRYFNSGGKVRKALIVYGGIIGVLFVFSLITLPFASISTRGPEVSPEPALDNTADASSPKTFWSRHSGRWRLEVPKTDFSMLFRFEVQNEAVSHFEAGAKTGDEEHWGLESGLIGPVQIIPASEDDATITFRMMAKVHEIKLHVTEEVVTGTTSDGEPVSGQID